MKKYNVIVTDAAKEQLADYISYILKKFKNKQAARALRDDVRETKNELAIVADSISPMQNEKFAGYSKNPFPKTQIYNDLSYRRGCCLCGSNIS